MTAIEITSKSGSDLTLDEVMQIVQGWPPTRRVKLLQKVAETFVVDPLLVEKKAETFEFSASLEEIWSLLPQDLPQWTDEELDAMKLEWRAEKYG